jgi:hypothetical protein
MGQAFRASPRTIPRMRWARWMFGLSRRRKGHGRGILGFREAKGGGGSGIGGTKPFASYYGLAPHSYVSPTYIDGYICTGTMKMYVYTFAIHRN